MGFINQCCFKRHTARDTVPGNIGAAVERWGCVNHMNYIYQDVTLQPNICHSKLWCFNFLCVFFRALQTTIKLLNFWGHWWRYVQKQLLDSMTQKSNAYFGKKKKLQFSVSCSVSVTHQGLGLQWANNMLEWCEIRALQERREIGWLVLHSGNCSRQRLPDAGGDLCTNFSHIRRGDGQGRATGLSGFSLATQLAWSD